MLIYRTNQLMSSVPGVSAFERIFLDMRHDLYHQEPITRGEWQSQQISMPMLEMLHVVMEMPMPATAEQLAEVTGARMPWAEDHFQERVGGQPLNPSPSEAWWPFRKKSADGDTNKDHKSEGEAFSHTYPERMWPKWANVPQDLEPATGYPQNRGIRFDYGDLRDVVNQLHRAPLTRQAYLPIWFPEDTGAVHGKRVPCTLGYHFLITHEGKLDISYFMRSTDLLRHFQDDVYMAIRLAQWVVYEFNLISMADAAKEYSETGAYTYREDQDELKVGKLVFHTANMHIFEGDKALIDYWKSQGKSWF